MMVVYSSSELIAMVRVWLGLEHTRSDCNAAQTDGVDADAIISTALRTWYLDLLDSGDTRYVCARAVSDAVLKQTAAAPRGMIIDVPEYCRRLLRVRLAGWHHSVYVADSGCMEEAVKRQQNPYTAATSSHPVAVAAAGGRSVYVWPAADEVEKQLVEAAGTCDDGPETYTFDESALALLRQYVVKNVIIPDYGIF